MACIRVVNEETHVDESGGMSGDVYRSIDLT
jgi:hypothetical protein